MNSPITIISTAVAMFGLLALARRLNKGKGARRTPADLATFYTPDELAYFHWMS